MTNERMSKFGPVQFWARHRQVWNDPWALLYLDKDFANQKNKLSQGQNIYFLTEKCVHSFGPRLSLKIQPGPSPGPIGDFFFFWPGPKNARSMSG